MIDYPKPPFAKQQQSMPGCTRKMDPIPDHGERSYKGSGRLAGKKAIITGGDSGIGRAVAIAYAREGADLHAMFYLVKAAVPHMKPGSAIVNTASINSDVPNPTLLAYATTKGAIQNFTAGLAQLLANKGIRANAVAPGPIWTPLIPSTMPEDAVANFGKQVPMGRPGQPAELATAFVMLADPLSSYVSGATIAVTGGKPIL
jgi:NAD(P)-dependent dehydrogenase (short-subunit alcohol dehydrogenase family)